MMARRTRFLILPFVCLNALWAGENHDDDDAFWADAAALLPGFTGTPAEPGASDQDGRWSGVINWPHVPVSAASLPNGKILTFSGQERGSWPGTKTQTYWTIYDPETNRFDESLYLNHEMFCAHLVMRADGMVQTVGGRYTIEHSSVFDFRSNEWKRVDDMEDRRWYTTSVALPDGDVFTVAGSGGENTAERFSDTTQTWRKLTGINWQPVSGAAGFESRWWPYVFVAPNGKLFHFGPTETMHWVDPDGNGSRTSAGLNVPSNHYPKHAGVTMYDSGKILIAGGAATTSGGSTNKAYTVDLNTNPPTVQQVASMRYPRRFSNAVVLPSGEVMIVGGNTSGKKFNDEGTILTPEIWNPRTNTWREVADMARPRNYHSVGLLLADGRVFAGGNGYPNPNQQNGEIFTPPSLYNASGQLANRPVLNTAPEVVSCGSVFEIEGTANLKKFAAIRLLATTHGLSTDQRYLRLPFSETSTGTYQLVAHPNVNVMVPGYWMIFGLDANGVHSKAKIVQVTKAGTSPSAGLEADYHNGVSLANKQLERVDHRIDYNYGTLGPDAAEVGNDNFSIRWDGWVVPDYTGTFTFYTKSDDGVRLWVNNQSLVSNWTDHAPTENSGSIALTAGVPVPLRMEFYERASGAVAELRWSGPGTPKQIIPQKNLRFENPSGSAAVAVDDVFELYVNGDLVSIGTEWNQVSQVSFETGASTVLAIRACNTGGGFFALGDFMIAGERVVTDASWKVATSAPSEWNQPGFNDGAWASATDYGGIPSGVVGMPVGSPARRIWAADGNAEEVFLRLTTGGPQMGSLADRVDTVGQAVALTVPVTAPASSTLTFSAQGLPAGVGIQPSTGQITGTFAGEGIFTPSVTVEDQNGLTASAAFQWVVRLPGQGDGTILREWWSGVTGSTLADLLGNEDYPFNPTGSELVSSFPVGVNSATNYGSRFRGYVHAPVTGSYRFWLSSDDEGRLLLSTDASPDNSAEVASVPSWSGVNEWTKFPEQQSAEIALVGGQRYYLEILHKQGTGGDHVNLGWQIPGDAGLSVMVGDYLSPYQPNRAPEIAALADQAHTIGQTVDVNLSATDADSDPVTFAASGLPGGLTLDAATGAISGTLNEVGVFQVGVSASDGQQTDTMSFAWTVNPELSVPDMIPSASALGVAITFTASPSGGTNPRYRWNVGDGSGDSAWSSSPTFSHTYESPGRFLVRFTATDDSGAEVSTAFVQNVYPELLAERPTLSQSVIYESRDGGNDRVWNVNPDNDTVSVFDAVTHAKVAEIAVGASPRSLAWHAASGTVWVTVKADATLVRIQTSDLTRLPDLLLPRGSQPHGIAFDPQGTRAYVALEMLGQVLQLDASGTELGLVSVGTTPRHLSVSSDGSKVYVSRFITPRLPGEATAFPEVANGGGDVMVLGTAPLDVLKTITLAHSDEPDSGGGGRGIPNYLGPAALSPAGDMAWVASKQDNVLRGTLRDGRGLTHENSVRAVTSRLDLVAEMEDAEGRIDHDDAAVPSTAIFGPNGLYVFVALEGSREVAVVDAYGKQELFRFDAGRAPQGLALSQDGKRLFVHNFMSRTVSVHDISAVIDQGSDVVGPLEVYNAVSNEQLSSQVLLGKQLFYDANDDRLSREDYISCASCHNDGGHDGRVWDMTGFGEGLRNTIDLRGRGGVGHGPLHWSANFDEVHDFENQIRTLALGNGLITDGDPHPPLGLANAGRSAALDALAAYVSSLTETPASPYRDANGALTSEGMAGRDLFRAKDCASCHAGSRFTDSGPDSLHDIGTIKASSGGRLGGALTGIDTPTLRGLWDGAPYLHDGSAGSLAEAIAAHNGLSVTGEEIDSLVAYLLQIDGGETTAPSNGAPSLENPGNQVGEEGSSANLALIAADPNDDPLTFSSTSLPAGLVIDPNSGVISGVLQVAGTTNVTVTVSDGVGGSDSVSFTWTVNAVNPAENDLITAIDAPAVVQQGQSVVATVDYETTAAHELWIWVQDSNSGWRTVATDNLTLSPGIGSHTFNLTIAGDARVGDGYLWVVRLLPQGWSSAEDALSADYLPVTVQTGSSGGGGEPTADQLGGVNFPGLVNSPGSVTLEVPYEVTETRELRVWLHDSLNGWFTIAQGSTVVERGFGTHTFTMPVLADARVGDGYVWALRLLPVDWESADDALDADYADARVERGSGGGDPTRDVFVSVNAAPTVQAAGTTSILIEYETTQRREIGIWLHDANDNWSTIASDIRTVDAGFGNEVITLGVASDARLGDGHLWAIRLLPEGWSTSDDALDAFYQDVTVQELDDGNTYVNLVDQGGVTATQSSVFGTAFTADLAIDGNTDGDWRNGSVTHTELGVHAWWEVDLGAVQAISHLNVWNRTDCCGDEWLSAYHVFVSEVPFASTDLAATMAQSGVSDFAFSTAPSATQRVDVNRMGRYVRVQLSGSNYLALAEVEVFGPGERLRVAQQVSTGSDGTLTNTNVYGDNNSDGDLLDLTAEYALGRNPYEAQPGDPGFEIDLGLAGETITLSYERPARLSGVRYEVEVSGDLETWTPLYETAETVEVIAYRQERLTFPHLELQPGLSREHGFARLRITHQGWGSVSTTPIMGWKATTFGPGFQTHGLALNQPAVFTSQVQGWTEEGLTLGGHGLGSLLSSEHAYYIEFVSGTLTGHRIDIDVTGTTDTVVRLDWAAPHNTLEAIPGTADWFHAQVVVRPHWTLGSAYPVDTLLGATDPAGADQLHFYHGEGYDSYFVLQAEDRLHWVAQDDEALLSADGLVIPPGVGAFLERPAEAQPLALTYQGSVREGAFAQPLVNGHHLLASPRPIAMSLEDRGMTVADGFQGSRDAEQADQVHLWQGDGEWGVEGYRGYFLLDAGSDWQFWTEMGPDLPDVEALDVLAGDRAFFFRLNGPDRLDYRVPGLKTP